MLKWHIVGNHVSRFKYSQSVTCLATDACLTSDPGVPILIAARSNTFMEIDHVIISTVKMATAQACHSSQNTTLLEITCRGA